MYVTLKAKAQKSSHKAKHLLLLFKLIAKLTAITECGSDEVINIFIIIIFSELYWWNSKMRIFRVTSVRKSTLNNHPQ